MATILITNGEVVSPFGSCCQDVYIADGRIAAIGLNLPVSAERTIDATGWIPQSSRALPL